MKWLENDWRLILIFANIRKQIANKKINSTNLEGSVDRSLLNRVKEEGPNIRESLLEKGEEEQEK